MTIDSLIAEIEADYSSYKASGLLNKPSLYRWTFVALKKFGQSICELTENVVEVKNGQAQLPGGFHSLHLAAKCDLSSYFCKQEDIPVIQNSIMWKERIERKSTSTSCTPCCVETIEKCITENIILNDRAISFYYTSPMLLKLGKSMKKNNCTKDCRNLFVTNCPYEITISNNTLYTNFPEGTIYLQYYGLPTEADGTPIIPDTPRGELATYIEYYLKERLLAKIMGNNDDPNLANDRNYYSNKTERQFPIASSDAKFMTLSTNSYKKLTNYNRGRMAQIEYLIPTF